MGAIPVPLNSKLLNEEIISIIDDYNFKFLITDKDYRSNDSKIDFKIIPINDLKTYKVEKTNFTYPKLDDEAVVIFTSGSTGKPKGVVHTFSSLINNIEIWK